MACGACGGRAGKWVSGEVAVHLGPPVLDKVERSWSCWRHPNASGVGVNVACAMGNTRFSQAPWDRMTAGSDREVVRKSTIVLIGAAAGPWVDFRTTPRSDPAVMRSHGTCYDAS